MGASGWYYFVPYQPDLQQALITLHDDVFVRGDYHHVEPYWRDMTFEEFLPPDPTFTEADRLEYQQAYDRLQNLSEPTTIEQLREWNGEEGTHSILDIATITAVPTIGTASPLSDEQLVAFFGTAHPDRAAATTRIHHLYDYLQNLGRYRYTATYIVIYQEHIPREILFIGYSGD